MIDYYKVYQSIDDNILKNDAEVILNKNLVQVNSLFLYVFALLGLVCLLISFLIGKKDLKKTGFFFILGIFFEIFCLGLSNSSFLQEKKNEKYSNNIEIIQINDSIKRQKELFKDAMENKDPKEFLEQGKKLEKFCSFYYSPTDNNFCKDNKINRYTFNLVFSKIYGNNEDKTTDLEKALKYIKEEN